MIEGDMWKRFWTMAAGMEEEGAWRTRVLGNERKEADMRKAKARGS